jgi:hypothetical protein
MDVKIPSIKGKIFYDPRTQRGVYFAYDVEDFLRAAVQYTLEQATEKAKIVEDVRYPDEYYVQRESVISLKNEILKQIGL